ncbi:polynucleotide adenylyltransferase PcnB [Cardiobacterium hominis]|uniref:polynucleotide adenylyltransferase PcnB n=1 Tax=Cardiobacterium hominis TaxID=2718 RepID=UPI0006600D67|nr:polynucleotide adenylyltransferase PcnB [Cardiobacterium hominis]
MQLAATSPVVRKHGEHPIDEQQIDPRALKILRQLDEAGFEAYLVGGCIRDLLLGKQPKDFDIATNARPEQIASIFRNCRLIGRRFRLAHIHFGRYIIEVATFRAPPEREARTDSYGSVLEDNHYGTLEDDVVRRDFTINALYYDSKNDEIRDYVGALDDINRRIIRIIGDPVARYTEDPVRMLRAARFSAKLNMPLESDTEAAIVACRDNLRAVPAARLFDEVQKLFMSGYGQTCFDVLQQHGLFEALFPDAEKTIHYPHAAYAQYAKNMMRIALANTDERIAADKPVTIAFLLAAILWPVYQLQYRGLLKERDNWHSAMHEAIDLVHIAASERVAIPVRLRGMIREIWALQARLEQAARGNIRKMHSVLAHPRFRAAYDFLLVRQGAGEDLADLVELWTALQQDPDTAADVEQYRAEQSEDEESAAAPRKRRSRNSNRRKKRD